MKFGGCGQHFDLGDLPDASGDGHQLCDKTHHRVVESSFLAVVSRGNHVKYFVNARVGGQCAVEYGKVTLQSLRYVVATTAWLNHGGQKLECLKMT